MQKHECGIKIMNYLWTISS